MLRKVLGVGFAVIVFNFLFFSFREGTAGYLIGSSFGTIWFLLGTVAAQIFLPIVFFQAQFSRKQTFAVVASVLAVIASWAALFRGSGVDQFLFNGLSVGLTMIALYLYALRHESFGAVTEILLLPLLLFGHWLSGAAQVISDAPSLFSPIIALFTQRRPKLKVSSSVGAGLVRGAVITIPVVLVIFLLLVSADPIFAHIVQNLWTFHLPALPMWLVFRVMYSLICIAAVAPIAWFAIKEYFHSPFEHTDFRKMHIESMMLSGAVALLLGAFLLIQFRYVFTTVSETELHQFGVQTYSEYVKRGFVELLLVSAIVYAVAGLGMVVQRVAAAPFSKKLRALNIFLLAETLVFVFSIARRDWLYAIYHGLTRIRVYGMVFLVVVFFWIVTLIFRHFKTKVHWYLWELGWVVLVFFGIFFLRVDQLIASSFPPTVNGEIDYVYISRLSPDAYEGWIESYHWALMVVSDPKLVGKSAFTPDEVRRLTYASEIINTFVEERAYLSRKYDNLNLDSAQWMYPEIKRVNYAEQTAYEKVKPSIFTSELDALKTRADLYMSLINQQPNRVPLDRSNQSPLVR